jgi:hypothetical protein
MMSDKEFAELELRATICPGQCEWPAPEYPPWQRLHEAGNEARSRVSKFYTLADEIDRNTDLSPDDKYRQRSKTADEAIADFELSKTLARAREAVDSVIQQWKRDEQHVSTEIAEPTLKAMKEAEAGWQRAIDLISERACLTKSPAPNWRAAKFRPRPVTRW